MSTYIAFGDGGFITVEEDLQAVVDAFAPAAQATGGFATLTQVSDQRHRIGEPQLAYVNPDRVTYMREGLRADY